MLKKLRLFRFPPVLQTLLIALAGLAAIFPAVLLFLFADDLGPWWIVLLLAYFALLFFLRTVIHWRRERSYLIYYLGKEGFYQAFPEERKRMLRRKEREKRRKNRAAEF